MEYLADSKGGGGRGCGPSSTSHSCGDGYYIKTFSTRSKQNSAATSSETAVPRLNYFYQATQSSFHTHTDWDTVSAEHQKQSATWERQKNCASNQIKPKKNYFPSCEERLITQHLMKHGIQTDKKTGGTNTNTHTAQYSSIMLNHPYGSLKNTLVLDQITLQERT